jgi:hypothetical protein
MGRLHSLDEINVGSLRFGEAASSSLGGLLVIPTRNEHRPTDTLPFEIGSCRLSDRFTGKQVVIPVVSHDAARGWQELVRQSAFDATRVVRP